MWHRHILDTRAYASDCERIFRNFMHYFPYFGLRGEADAVALESALRFPRRWSSYEDAFGGPPRGDVDLF